MAVAMLLTACGGGKKTMSETEKPVGPQFSADSAYTFCQQQCDFGPRTMNSEAHEQCGQWIVEKFQGYGMDVTEQRATLKGFDGTPLQSNNIIARYQPDKEQRILLCAHWDSRPWADNDPDEANHTKPVMAANDGASGVGVMLEVSPSALTSYVLMLRTGAAMTTTTLGRWAHNTGQNKLNLKPQISNLKPTAMVSCLTW